MKAALFVFLGGGLGSVSRYVTASLMQYFGYNSAIGTYLSNILACIIFGLILWLSPERLSKDVYWTAFWLVGFCGGYSTFSTFSFENFQFIKNGQWHLAVINVVVSVLACLAIFFVMYRQFRAE